MYESGVLHSEVNGQTFFLYQQILQNETTGYHTYGPIHIFAYDNNANLLWDKKIIRNREGRFDHMTFKSYISAKGELHILFNGLSKESYLNNSSPKKYESSYLKLTNLYDIKFDEKGNMTKETNLGNGKDFGGDFLTGLYHENKNEILFMQHSKKRKFLKLTK